MSLSHQFQPDSQVPMAIPSARLPQTYETAKNALAECQAVDECKEWADKAAALASYAKQAEDLDLERMAARIRVRALRRAGELLKQVDGRGDHWESKRDVAVPSISQRAIAGRAGMSERQQKTAVRIANVPPADFEKQVESPNPPTLTALAQQGTHTRPAPNPESWLKGRDPHAFNKAMHFVALVDEYAAELGKANIDAILPSLDADQARKMRELIASIDGIHDIIATRI